MSSRSRRSGSRRPPSSSWSPRSAPKFDLSSILVRGGAGNDQDAQRRAGDDLPSRSRHRDAVLAGVLAAARSSEIRFPSHLGIAGAVFTSGAEHEHPLCLCRPPVQSGLRPADRLLHPVDPLRADRQQGRQGDRRLADAEQARRHLHRRGRAAAEGVHGADRHRARELQAVRRRQADEGLHRLRCCRACRTVSSRSTRATRSSPATPRAGESGPAHRRQPGRQGARDAHRRRQQVAGGRDREGRCRPASARSSPMSR